METFFQVSWPFSSKVAMVCADEADIHMDPKAILESVGKQFACTGRGSVRIQEVIAFDD